MMNYHRCNGCKRFFYIGGSMVKGVRRMRVGHYETGG